MAVFVILAFTLAIITLAVLVLAAVQLFRALMGLKDSAVAVRDRMLPMTEELRDELAVTETESAALQQSLEGLRAHRVSRRESKQTVREGLRRTVRGK